MNEEHSERIAKALERIAEALPHLFDQGETFLSDLADIRDAIIRAAPPAGEGEYEEPEAERASEAP